MLLSLLLLGASVPPFRQHSPPNEDRDANLLFRYEGWHSNQGQNGNRVSYSRRCD
jgi:hypothetical protein